VYTVHIFYSPKTTANTGTTKEKADHNLEKLANAVFGTGLGRLGE